tara:strand:+ start:365 stop:565 length:201 start_codon:yes stop_codon:yes gene_type:complete
MKKIKRNKWTYDSPNDGITIIRTNDKGDKEYLVRMYGGNVGRYSEWVNRDRYYKLHHGEKEIECVV